MDKFDYITATIEEEKIRVEKIIKYLKTSKKCRTDCICLSKLHILRLSGGDKHVKPIK